MYRLIKTALFCLLAFQITTLFASQANAHRQGESYVFFSVTDEALSGRFEATLVDIDKLIPLDADGNGEVTRDEFNARADEVYSFFADRFSISSEGTDYPIASNGFDFLDAGFGTFAKIEFTVPDLSPTPESVEVNYEPLSDINPAHLGYGVIENNSRTGVKDNESYISMVFSPGESSQQMSLIGPSSWEIFKDFVIHGVWHIWLGFDHVLFLITLLLPAVLMRQTSQWMPVDDFRTAFINVIKIVTVFTVSHTITLSLAALGVFTLPVSFVEAVIALSIAVVALGNMFPIFHNRVLIVVFIFGLFHGFGFANVLEPLGVNPAAKVVGLAAFNIGVELGQIAIVAVLFPILYLIRRWSAYPFLALKVGSVAIILVAGLWLVERTSGMFWEMQQQLFASLG